MDAHFETIMNPLQTNNGKDLSNFDQIYPIKPWKAEI